MSLEYALGRSSALICTIVPCCQYAGLLGEKPDLSLLERGESSLAGAFIGDELNTVFFNIGFICTRTCFMGDDFTGDDNSKSVTKSSENITIFCFFEGDEGIELPRVRFRACLLEMRRIGDVLVRVCRGDELSSWTGDSKSIV